MSYQIFRAYPDGVDADYRIDAFDIETYGHVTLDQAIRLHDAGVRFHTGTILTRADVVKRKHWAYPYREYLTTLPDDRTDNNLSTLSRPSGLGALASAVRGYRP